VAWELGGGEDDLWREEHSARQMLLTDGGTAVGGGKQAPVPAGRTARVGRTSAGAGGTDGPARHGWDGQVRETREAGKAPPRGLLGSSEFLF
jgi:hypothetical protein